MFRWLIWSDSSICVTSSIMDLTRDYKSNMVVREGESEDLTSFVSFHSDFPTCQTLKCWKSCSHIKAGVSFPLNTSRGCGPRNIWYPQKEPYEVKIKNTFWWIHSYRTDLGQTEMILNASSVTCLEKSVILEDAVLMNVDRRQRIGDYQYLSSIPFMCNSKINRIASPTNRFVSRLKKLSKKCVCVFYLFEFKL